MQSWFPGVKAETSQPPMRMKGLCVGVCTTFSCLNLVTSLSPPAAGMSNSALPAQLPPDTTPHEGLAFLLWPLGGHITPSAETAHRPARQPMSAATINSSSARKNRPTLCLEGKAWRHTMTYSRTMENLISKGTERDLVFPCCHVHLCLQKGTSRL